MQQKQKYFLKKKEILVSSYFNMANIQQYVYGDYNVIFSKSWTNGIAYIFLVLKTNKQKTQ